jgi:glycosyltransferase involved in cell wall biosynthesis
VTLPSPIARTTKVLLLVVGFDVGGTEAHVLELASRIDRRKFNVMVCSLKPLGRLGEELRAQGIRVVSLSGIGKFDLRVMRRLWRVLKKEQPDVVQAFLFWANIAARLLSQLTPRCRVISSYHDEVVLEGWFNRAIDRLTMNWTKYIVCCSEAVRGSVERRIGGEKEQFVVIPFGVEANRFGDVGRMSGTGLGLHEGLPVIGTVCRLIEPKKGLKFLLEAVAHLEREVGKPVCQVLIVGEGPAEENLRALSAQLGIAPRVVFSGMRRDIPQLLTLMDIFVLPSLYEGFGISILEAMAAGKPVVASRVGGIPEFVASGESGLLVQPGDSVALAAAIKQLLAQPEQAKVLGRRGQDHVRKHYSIESVVRQHEQLYEMCVTQTSSFVHA